MAVPTGILFDYPITTPLSVGPTPQVGSIISGCSLVFYLTQTTTATPVYSDGNLAVSIGNVVNSNASGQFIPIYLNPLIIYRIQLWSQPNGTGIKLQDIDPYIVSQAGITAGATPGETAAGVTIVNPTYPVGNLLRYGIVPNSPSAATNNTTVLRALFNPTVKNGPTGLITSPNTGGAAGGTTPDIYYFNSLVQMRDGIALDFGGCQWNVTYAPNSTDTNNGFLQLMRNVIIRNGQLYVNFTTGGSGNPGAISCIMLGGRGVPVSGSPLPTIYDSVLVDNFGALSPMGNITIENLYINVQSNLSTATNSVCGFDSLGGLKNVLIRNVLVEGNGQIVYGLYNEFGFATQGLSQFQRQSSHSSNWKFENFRCQNISSSSTSNGAIVMNGAYNIIFDGVDASNSPEIITMGSGESMFLVPWVGVDDIGTLVQNGALQPLGQGAAGRTLMMRNIKGRFIGNSTAITVNGNTGTSGQNSTLVTGWLPNTAYVSGQTVYNGTFKYSANANGTSSNAAGFAGPIGGGSSVSDGAGGMLWTFVGPARNGTGYQGYKSNIGGAGVAYIVGDIQINGQYAYKCTVAGTTVLGGQGPTGVGTAIADPGSTALTWASIPTSVSAGGVNTAWAPSTEQFQVTLDGFEIDTGVTGATSGGTGVFMSAGQVRILNGRISNFTQAILISCDTTNYSIENVECLNNGGAGSGIAIRVGFQSSQFSPARLSQGSIRNCFIAGTALPIVAINHNSLLIENNRFGYEIAHDGIADGGGSGVATQLAVDINQTCFNVVCRNNYVAASANPAYAQVGASTSNGCLIDGMSGPIQTYSGNWEGVLQSTTITVTAATPGTISPAYTVQKCDFIKRGLKVDYSLELVMAGGASWGSASGAVSITGLPYNMNSGVVGSQPISTLLFNGITKASYTQFGLVLSGGQNAPTLQASGSGQSQTAVNVADIPTLNTLKLFASGTYFTNL